MWIFHGVSKLSQRCTGTALDAAAGIAVPTPVGAEAAVKGTAQTAAAAGGAGGTICQRDVRNHSHAAGTGGTEGTKRAAFTASGTYPAGEAGTGAAETDNRTAGGIACGACPEQI